MRNISYDYFYLQGSQVLLAEDNKINQQIAFELLADIGVKLDIVSNGALAVEALLSHPAHYYEAILMDLQMPVLDGIDAARKIRESFPDIPIIAMTAHAMVEEKQRCYHAGMNDHVAKPVEPKMLYAALARWLKPKPEIPQILTQETVQDNDALPETLLPFNIAAALLRVNRKKMLLRKLIVDFYFDYQQVLETLPSLDRHEARRLVHSLKGIANTLEIADLPIAASRLENALANAFEPIDPELYQSLEAALLPALQAASELVLNVYEAPERQDLPTAYKQDGFWEELESLLAINNLKARKCYEQLKSTVPGIRDHELYALLNQQINSLDFEGARATLQTIRESLPPIGVVS